MGVKWLFKEFNINLEYDRGNILFVFINFIIYKLFIDNNIMIIIYKRKYMYIYFVLDIINKRKLILYK